MERGVVGHHVAGPYESTTPIDERKRCHVLLVLGGTESWSDRDKEDYDNFFEPNNLRLEDLETLTGVGFMKTVKAFYHKRLATSVLESGYVFKEDNGKKTYLNFKWEGNDFVTDTANVYLQKTKSSAIEYHPAF